MSQKRKHHNSASDDADVRHTVNSLKRKHQQEAVLAGEDGPSTLFWSKKVEQDVKSGAGANTDKNQLAREREAELQRVRARRCRSLRALLIRWHCEHCAGQASIAPHHLAARQYRVSYVRFVVRLGTCE